MGQVLLLEEGFAAGEDEAVAVVVRDERGNLGGGELDDLLRFGEFHPVLVFPGSFLPVPSVGGVAPVAMQVAEGQSQEDGGSAEGRAFALQGVKDLGRAVGKAGDFHGGA